MNKKLKKWANYTLVVSDPTKEKKPLTDPTNYNRSNFAQVNEHY